MPVHMECRDPDHYNYEDLKDENARLIREVESEKARADENEKKLEELWGFIENIKSDAERVINPRRRW